MDADALSPNCRAARGRPNREHHCTGCRDCPCHAVPAPVLRDVYLERLAERGSPRLGAARERLGRDEPGEGE